MMQMRQKLLHKTYMHERERQYWGEVGSFCLEFFQAQFDKTSILHMCYMYQYLNKHICWSKATKNAYD